jgi:hypothetical protein
MPTQKGFWLHDEERLFPCTDHPCQEYEEQPIRPRACWSFDLSPKNDELLPEEGILGYQFGFPSSKICYRSEKL